MPKVYVKFPKTGLGNLLLVWAKARVFAHLNEWELICSPWWGLRWGAIMRRESRSRLYRNYFRETPLLKRIWYKVKSRQADVIFDPEVVKYQDTIGKDDTLFVFQKVINDIDLFGSIRAHRSFIEQELYALLHPKRRAELARAESPVLAVHIRRGDFKIGNQETPLAYFIELIQFIRDHAEASLPVTIFSDAATHELTELLALPDVTRAKKQSDIVDILTMSRSKILVTSRSSTFSYWAAFLSDALVILPEGDWQDRIRGKDTGAGEFKWDPSQGNELLIEAIKNCMPENGSSHQQKTTG